MSLHGDAYGVLKRYGGQPELRDAYLAHLDAHPDDGMWKACGAGHVTASALVVCPERGEVLLTLHRKLRLWLQMGGHCEPGDVTLADAALREAREESGIGALELHPGGPVRLDLHPIPGPCTRHFDVQYVALAPAAAAARISDESLDLRWFGYAEAAEIGDASVALLVGAAREALGV
ncbi:NUDIX hydrolase [Streptomyces evansiae]|uniref:NUDIX hydrolase n=1 Tax=Streptomyces evansiae TaxID=3075535 RepID=UPI002886924D|nr:NUDIX hydrolase [Streptomyces sp. DSM 41859]MDT0425678.1 NUDIX hydrolase [Streptomyces sp. DSM 41859]